ncbi:hypothetical protein [Lentzea sp. NPDC060358]|uniref:hypothetical protein n=1 Tax=Lentzea sp. NPDC060358 TaxID=3347103 RepID=UPI00365DE89D
MGELRWEDVRGWFVSENGCLHDGCVDVRQLRGPKRVGMLGVFLRGPARDVFVVRSP